MNIIKVLGDVSRFVGLNGANKVPGGLWKVRNFAERILQVVFPKVLLTRLDCRSHGRGGLRFADGE